MTRKVGPAAGHQWTIRRRATRFSPGSAPAHLPSTAHLPWRAVPGGAGSGRCGGRCQGVLGLRLTRLARGKLERAWPAGMRENRQESARFRWAA